MKAAKKKICAIRRAVDILMTRSRARARAPRSWWCRGRAPRRAQGRGDRRTSSQRQRCPEGVGCDRIGADNERVRRLQIGERSARRAVGHHAVRSSTTNVGRANSDSSTMIPLMSWCNWLRRPPSKPYQFFIVIDAGARVVLHGRDADELRDGERKGSCRTGQFRIRRPPARVQGAEVARARQHHGAAGGAHRDPRERKAALGVIDRIVGHEHSGGSSAAAEPHELRGDVRVGCRRKDRRDRERRVDLHQHAVAWPDEPLDPAQGVQRASKRAHPVGAGYDRQLPSGIVDGEVPQRRHDRPVAERAGRMAVPQPCGEPARGRDGRAGSAGRGAGMRGGL